MTELTRAVLITGASSGIGYATALTFARQGWNVAAIARRVERLASLAEAAIGFSGTILPLEADVTDREAVQRCVDQAVARFGRLDVVVANAGLGQRGAVAEAEWSHIEAVLRTNVEGVYHTIRAGIPAIRHTRGQIVIITSVLATLIAPYYATYAATKAFKASLIASLRMELEEDGIAVTDMRVGRTATDFNANRLGSTSSAPKQSHKLVPVMTPEFVADGILRAVERRSRVVYLRWFDRMLAWGGLLVARADGAILARTI
ncbi:MAG: SDR family NAD(P)-dependent oxidoreductase [Chloroflexi bacterium]|nr:SDR family NAD(P)-dependent oxidoreductase [Chloroflexota bacterium]